MKGRRVQKPDKPFTPSSFQKTGRGRRGEEERETFVSPSPRLPISPSPSSTVSPSPHRPVSQSPPPPVSQSPRACITLLTDFGTADYFVGAMKGVVLSLNPDARIVDITHEIPPHDVEAGAFTLLSAYKAFSAPSIHVAVVDPGVGSSRRPLVIAADGQFFVGPDNGIFSYICEREAGHQVFHLTNEKYFRHPVSATFHGRDIFAPVAAALSCGTDAEEFGPAVEDYNRLASLAPEKRRNGTIKARVIHIDRFGNCITNLTEADLTESMIESGVELTIKGRTVRSFKHFFAEETEHGVKLFGLWGSAGFLEIATTNGSAAKVLKAKRGDSVIVHG